MSTTGAVVLTLLVLGLSGALPVLTLVGPRLVAFPLAPLAGSLLCAAAAVCSLVVAGSVFMWFVLWALAAATVGATVLVRRPERRHHLGQVLRGGVPPLVGVGAVVVLGTVAWSLRTLRVPTVGFDSRAIWILHARWLAQGHTFALAAVRNKFLVLSHPGYPPLTSSVMALAWRVTGTSSDRVAVVMVALLNACALLVAGWALVEAGRHGAARLYGGGRRRQLLIAASIGAAVLTVLVAGGVIGTYATNGYADPLWSLGAVAGVVYGLVLPPSRANLAVAAIVVGVAGLTKIEGTAVAMVLVVVIAARLVLRLSGPMATRRRRVVGAAGGGLVALMTWPVLTLILGVPTDPSLTGSRQGSLLNRAHHTLSAMAPHLYVVGLAALCSVAGFVLLGRVRERLGLGNDLWVWLALVAATVVLGGAYVFGPGNVELWLATSVNRTTIFVALLGWWIVALWALCGSAGVSLSAPWPEQR